MSQSLLSRRDGDVVTLTLCTPPNPLTSELVAALGTELAAAVAAEAAALVIAAEGTTFSAGFDLRQRDPAETDAEVAARFAGIATLLEAIRQAPLLTIAACRGAAVGAGADLLAACAVRYASPAARFRFPGAALGVCLGTGRLAQLIGADRTLTWVICGDWIDAEQAASAGLITAVVDDPAAAAAQLAARAAALPPGTTGLLASAVVAPLGAAAGELLGRSAASPGLAARVHGLRRPAHTPAPTPGGQS